MVPGEREGCGAEFEEAASLGRTRLPSGRSPGAGMRPEEMSTLGWGPGALGPWLRAQKSERPQSSEESLGGRRRVTRKALQSCNRDRRLVPIQSN
ncbi:hypothetical protein GUJ93_ZPchr0007g4203 [Zizania palustris]|uniref:Uncharacterized protein n=1 Tax=Zizania palustris TaxID=103762 RepID=A0A8J5T735_ZIZPA|nr:hypothetical protein GUJ93_ZPchr0007g4203 [Zizania palustris]